MKHITIVGAGQAGLQLALGLLQQGYEVTVVSDRTPDQIRHGWATGAATLFSRSIRLERSLGQNDWAEAVGVGEAEMAFQTPDGLLAIRAVLPEPWLTVDQRLKHAHWLERFAALGGRVVIASASIENLDRYARQSGLVVVAAGARQFADLFERDADRSPIDRPQRHLLQVYLSGVRPWYDPERALGKIVLTPGAGEVFLLPFYTKDRERAHVVLIEAVPGGPLDLVRTVESGEAAVAAVKTIVQQTVPSHAPYFQGATLADERAWLRGAITPTVRRPVGWLPSGATVLGIGDVTILNDPIGGQGANSATKFAHLLIERIVERGERPFDPAWMEAVFEAFWDYSQYVNAFNNGLLYPPAPHQQQILLAASRDTAIALDFMNGFDHPPSLFPWFVDPEAAGRYLAERGVAEGAASPA